MRVRVVQVLLGLVVIGVLGVATGVGSVQADILWLDGPLANWNAPGMAVPAAPASDFSGNEAFCSGQARPPETPEDDAVVQAGWTLFGGYQSGWGTRVVGARVGLDGMCRPMDYQYFVFVNGRFAGTISPLAMGSRSDGSAGPPSMSGGGKGMNDSFARYAASDALCCPSATTYVTYRIDTVSGAPLLVPASANTSPNSP